MIAAIPGSGAEGGRAVPISKGNRQPDMGKAQKTRGVTANSTRQPKMYGKGTRRKLGRRFTAPISSNVGGT